VKAVTEQLLLLFRRSITKLLKNVIKSELKLKCEKVTLQTVALACEQAQILGDNSTQNWL
jgi:hypothetical protein